VTKLPGSEAEAEYVENASPRLVKVAAVTTISFALFDGANRALLDLKNADKNTREIASGYRGDAISMTVVRMVLLLDADPKVVSFQNVDRRLERPEVVDALVRRARAGRSRRDRPIPYPHCSKLPNERT
jgi:hypothetical protein